MTDRNVPGQPPTEDSTPSLSSAFGTPPPPPPPEPDDLANPRGPSPLGVPEYLRIGTETRTDDDGNPISVPILTPFTIDEFGVADPRESGPGSTSFGVTSPRFSRLGSRGILYYDGHQDLALMGWSSADIGRLQLRLQAKGFLTAGRYDYGVPGDIPTRDAIRDLMIAANAAPIPLTPEDGWQKMLNLAQPPPDDEEPGPLAGRIFVSDPYLPPDLTRLAQDVDDFVASKLGRGPSFAESQILADEYKAAHQARHATQVAADRARFDAENRAILTAQDTADPVIESAGTLAAPPDPAAAVRARLESLRSGEIEERERSGQVSTALAGTIAALSGAESVIGVP